MLYWKLVRRRLGSPDAGAHTYLEIFITISNRGFFHLACRFQLGRHTRDTIIVTDNFMDDTRGIIITFIVTRQVNFITPLPPHHPTTLYRSSFFSFFFFFYSLTIYFSWHAELPPERELVSNECHAFYVFWFLCSSRRETRADDF